MHPIKNRYDEVFAIEMDGWCFGLANYPGEISAQVIHRIIRELSTSFQAAIEHHVVFNILELANKFSAAARHLVHDRELSFAILAQLPNPNMLQDDIQREVLEHIIDNVEQVYEGAREAFYKRWQLRVGQEAA